jgi:hypothetical protein
VKHLYTLLFSILLLGCASHQKDSENIELSFLDEYVIPIGEEYEETLIGGISGIDYVNGFYYLIVDDSKNPRFYKAEITLQNKEISDLKIIDVVSFKDHPFYKENALDLESIIVDISSGNIVLTSEGKIKDEKNPLLFVSNSKGKFIKNIPLPERFSAISEAQPIHNKTLEGLSRSFDDKGYWTAMELPLKIDGEEPKYLEANSPIRITYFDKEKEKATKEFVYQLSPITKPFIGDFNLNGVTDILEFKPNHFFMIERIYQSGYGAYGNIVRVYHAYADENTTNSLAINSLKEINYIPLKKELILDFDSFKDNLTENIVDNIEGITFGPILPNGNKTLLFVSDDNFQVYGKQLNQFLLFEIK